MLLVGDASILPHPPTYYLLLPPKLRRPLPILYETNTNTHTNTESDNCTCNRYHNINLLCLISNNK